ncbi:hypothetical protein DMN91_002938 [Ooceraea biroi]|uniref:Sphingomyelin phosphodiesterase n=1 Tax=Ooceraea biroi TaxID=2015173 RepID=A0A026WAA6_OOCBI|nr:sphingomyelin phosphodiesterase [Ooceraea biroi]EZA53027.1 Sphingomyelin phosphodiesterase [Ooceraea biroi]RLU24848.1 hypothetical protein DMN91_002938 [Ooceraea biroi]
MGLLDCCKLLFLVLLFRGANSDGTDDEVEMISQFSHEIDNWLKFGNESESFQYMINSLALPTSLQREDWRSFTAQRGMAICIICRSALNIFIEHRRKGMTADVIRSKAIHLCTLLNIQPERVCDGAVTLNLQTILYIIDAKPNLTASTICGVLLESKSCPLINDEFNWTINIDSGPPKLTRTEDTDETIDIVQITDIHYDPKYEPDGNSHCNEPTCCRRGQNRTNTSGKRAGYWGDYNYCDTPWHSVVDALDHIKDTHQNISYVYFTGDIIDHGVWETTMEGNILSLSSSYHQIYKTFGSIPVYPILGNHEPHPLNLFAPKTVSNNEISTQWLYNMMANLWINNFGWLPESTRSTILQGGYYTVSPKKGFRIIVLNNNVCYCYNWWLWYEPKDPDGQLQWLADTLLQAEKDAELVHILAHIPPDNEHCQSTWKREYIKVINRFAHVIRAQFNGHTHNDELQLVYSNNITKIVNIAWNGGSLTAYNNLNPNYKLYTVNSNNYAVKDLENWMYNLTLANEHVTQRPLWYKSYSFKEEYDVTDLSYDSLHTWFSRLTRDDDLLRRYHRHFFKHAEPSLMKECNAKCLKAYLCRMIASLEDHARFCT